MWRTFIIGIISLVCFPCSLKAECKLNVAMYMPFLVRVVDVSQSGNHQTLSTGSILTPFHVLTTCVQLRGKINRDLEARASQGHYEIGKIDDNHFKQIGPNEDKKGCIQIRPVAEIRFHSRCPLFDEESLQLYSQDYMRFNVAVLKINDPFKNYTEAVPTMPFVGDVGILLLQVDDFNAHRNRRCEIPLYDGVEPIVKFHKDMTFRSMPLTTECKELMCQPHEDIVIDVEKCKKNMDNSTGFVLCAKRVKQSDPGVTWDDFKLSDKDYYNDKDDECKDLKHTPGSPLVCEGSAIGMVVECNPWGMVISTLYTLRNYIQAHIQDGFTEEVIYMDTSDIPTEADDPVSESEVRGSYRMSFQGHPRDFAYSNSNPIHPIHLLSGLRLLTMNVVFVLLK
ncbi:hypothetical protein GE061_003724 [Apolygus lucorum]|uniref:Peptidase S1 domain-containing protein n=1 Tax=Apolygus lucorum TaxID=248454 RepID=A0A8S9X5H0_APOLU|nr:hypothetical protein GE061_003724 [Apolygus lucorum]